MNKRSVGVRFHCVKSQDSDSKEPKMTIFDCLPLFSSHQLSPAAPRFHSFSPPPSSLSLSSILFCFLLPSPPLPPFQRVFSTQEETTLSQVLRAGHTFPPTLFLRVLLVLRHCTGLSPSLDPLVTAVVQVPLVCGSLCD